MGIQTSTLNDTKNCIAYCAAPPDYIMGDIDKSKFKLMVCNLEDGSMNVECCYDGKKTKCVWREDQGMFWCEELGVWVEPHETYATYTKVVGEEEWLERSGVPFWEAREMVKAERMMSRGDFRSEQIAAQQRQLQEQQQEIEDLKKEVNAIKAAANNLAVAASVKKREQESNAMWQVKDSDRLVPPPNHRSEVPPVGTGTVGGKNESPISIGLIGLMTTLGIVLNVAINVAIHFIMR